MICWRDKAAYLTFVSDFAVTAIGRDRPGIVAAISKTLLDLEGNIEDSQMSILRGHFAVMLVVHVPDGVAEDELATHLGQVRDELGLEAITFNPLEAVAAPAPEPTHVLTVYGADHPGIVAGISNELAGLGVNITDLETRLAGEGDSPIYMMVMELAMGDASRDEVEAALKETGGRAQVEVSLRELESDAL
jgi:glycine cleavage system transcriptional repressor